MSGEETTLFKYFKLGSVPSVPTAHWIQRMENLEMQLSASINKMEFSIVFSLSSEIS